MDVRIVGARLLVHVFPQLPGAAQRVKPKDPEENPGKLQPEHTGEPHKGTPHCLAKPLAAASHAFGRAPGLLGSSGYLLNRLVGRWPTGGCSLRSCACTLHWTRLRCRCGTRIRRRCSARSPNQRFCSGSRAYPERPAKTYGIHNVECSRSSSRSKDSSTIKRNSAAPHPSRKKIRERAKLMKGILYFTAGICAAAVGIIVWGPRKTVPVQELAHRLEDAWADHHTVA